MYSVPIIPPDLRHEETIIQAANALDYLQKTIADVFDRIDARIERNHVKVLELQNRIDSANKNIKSLVGINKAIKIFSPAKFPSVHVFQDIPKTFEEIEAQRKGLPAFKLHKDYRVVSNQDPITHRNIQDKLVFFHVRSTMQSNKSKCGQVLEQTMHQDLGEIPKNIKSINGLLRFNTNENVYQASELIETGLKSINSSRKKEKISPTGPKIEAPPMSMTSRKVGDKKTNAGLFYTPKLNEAPQMDVPMDLPDLPGIADDITFNLTESDRIAPSLFIENLPDLPEPDITFEDSREIIKQIHDEVPESNSTSIQPPPPSPPIEIVSSQNVPILTPPPPPPPPPIPAPKIPSASSTSKPETDTTDDIRMNLMEAIRKAGGTRGAKLKTAAAAEIVKTKEQESLKAETKPSGDLMADLHNKLLMRRKGISGAKEHEAGSSGIDSGNVMDRISALIPPPPPKLRAANNSATDISDENDDWTD